MPLFARQPALFAILFVIACSPSSPPARPAPPVARASLPPRTAPEPNAIPSDAGTPICTYDPATDEAFLRGIEREWSAAGDRRRLYASMKQRPPPGFKPFQGQKTFPTHFAKIVGYGFREADPTLDAAVKGCGLEGLAPDGTFCPSVVRSGVELSQEQIDRLSSALAKRDAELKSRPSGRAVSQCGGFEPHHTFVYYDEAGTPIGEVVVCFVCGEVMMRPSMMASEEATSIVERTARALCSELGLPGCPGDEDDDADWKPVMAAKKRREAAYLSGWPFDPAPLVAPRARLEDLSNDEKRALCQAFVDHHQRGGSFTRVGKSFECEAKEPYDVLTFDACVASMPKCDVEVARVAACWRRLVDDPCRARTETNVACASVKGCVWGIAKPNAL